jgi:hypothetical protein
MHQFEQDWLELGSRVARSLHYQHPRNLRLLQAAQAKRRRTALGAQEWTQSEGRPTPPRPKPTRPTTPEEVMPTAPVLDP